MRAVTIRSFGPELDVGLSDVPSPGQPGDYELLIRVSAAGVNRADLLQARGAYPPPPGYSPDRPGLEFAGQVIEVGPAVTRFRTGDLVMGISSGECQAELLKVDASLALPVPESIDTVTAAAIPEAFITAHDALITLAGLPPSETVLIHAAGSGVGLAALEIARGMGCLVIGTSRSAEKLERLTALGLDHAILASEPADIAPQVMAATDERGADVVLDLVGAAYLDANLRSMATGGRLIAVGLTSGRKAELDMGVLLQRRLRLIGTVLRSRDTAEKARAVAAFGSDLLPRIASGDIKPSVDKVFAAEEVREAYRYVESNANFGKVVLRF